MTTAIERTTTILLKTSILLAVINLAFACANTQNNPSQTDAMIQTVASADSTVQGKPFKWESLQALSNQLLTTKSWGQVNYNLKIKISDEKQAKDGQVTPNDSLTSEK